MKHKKKPKAKKQATSQLIPHIDSPIRKWLEENEMTQTRFAELIGVQTATVNGWCNNKNINMDASNLYKAVTIMGCSLEETFKALAWAAHMALFEEQWQGFEAD
jgi:DNA-binding transcriptional regulator YiaG